MRHHFPEGTHLASFRAPDLARVEAELNPLPRAVPGDATPHDLFRRLLAFLDHLPDHRLCVRPHQDR